MNVDLDSVEFCIDECCNLKWLQLSFLWWAAGYEADFLRAYYYLQDTHISHWCQILIWFNEREICVIVGSHPEQTIAESFTYNPRSVLILYMYVCVCVFVSRMVWTFQWRHKERDGVSNYQPHNYLLNVYRGTDPRNYQSAASLVSVSGTSPVTGEFPAQRASYVENVSIWWRHHELKKASEVQIESTYLSLQNTFNTFKQHILNNLTHLIAFSNTYDIELLS